MKYINVISKQNHNVIESKLDDNIIVKENSVVLIDANLEDVQKIERQGNDLIIHFKNGEILKISDFYNENNTADNSLVFKDDEAKLSWIQHLEDTQIIDKSIYYQSIDELEPLLYEYDAGFLIGTPWLFTGGVLAAGGLIAGLSSSNSKHEISTEDNTIAQPVAPTKYINDISGEIIYLSIDKISNDDTPSFVIQNLANGQTALLYVDGVKVDVIYDKASNTLTPKIPLAEGTHEISYIIVNQQGNVSSPSDKVVITIDVTAPIEPIITTNNASGLSGSSEANALITLDLGNGNTLTTTANSQGKWSFTPNPIADGETGKLTATDAAGNVGSSITTDKADQVAPLAPSVEQNNASGLGGTSEANALITLDLGNGNTLTTTTSSQGKWSFAPNPIADGETATLTATDAAGNVGAETTTEKADTVAPLAPSVEQNNALGLSGSSEANAVITLDLGHGNTLTTTANSQGKWVFAPNPLADGETGKLTATDAAGNTGAETTTDKADTVAPLAPSVEQNNAAGLVGTSEANALITLDLGNGNTLTTTADSQGKWSFTPNPIADGETGTLTATDAAGNVGAETITDKADTVAPLAPSVEQNNAASLSGTSEANALITLDLGDGNTLTTTANSQGKWSFAPNPIADGETGKLTATDAAGNVGAETITNKADTIAPLAPSVELNNAASLSGTSEANALIILDLGHGNTLTTTANSQGKWSFVPNPITDGETATLTATDAAGNVGASITTDKADTVAPLAPSVDLNNAITLSGTSEANAVITLDLGNGNTLTTTANSQGKWSFAPNPIAGGETATLTATDTAGNIGPSITTDKADTIAPLVPSVEQNNAANLSGSSEANALITLDLGNGNTLTTIANSQGKWSFVPNPITDLYLSTGYNNTVGGIYYNNAGKLSSTISTVGSTASAGYLSVALDWNHDGMMDLVKFTTYGTAQTATLFTNLNSGTNWNTGLLRSGLVNVTGIAALDYDWDGAVDLMVSQANGSIALIHNEQAIAKGTAMHLRIVDSEGINVYYGNTVQLYDSKGRLVASQIINPQSGIGSNDASAIVNFYGLDPNETYSATIVKMNKGVSNNVTWTGLVAGDGTESYALTAVAATGIHSGTLTGTGYNDTFIADTGTYVYNGSGGWSKVSGFGVWSASSGIDIVDYRNSTSGITIDLSKTGYQITGYNFAKFINIEGIAGTSSNDVFTNNGADNYFEGRGGNDIFNLINHGGHDTLIYKLINAADATGGNGVDTVNGFFVGTFETVPDADRIDIQGLLNGYTASGTDGYSAKYINGVATINAGDNISKYLNVYFDGTNTHVQIDRNGAGEFTDLLVMNNVQTDLATLLANHQITIA